MSSLRIFSPAKLSLGPGRANANDFDNVVQQAWTSYVSNPITIALSGRQFTGSASGQTLTFAEVNPAALNMGETFVVQQPSTQDILGCSGTMAQGVAWTADPSSALGKMQSDENAVQQQLENQICSAIKRGVLLTPSNWKNVSAYYAMAPANFYAVLWHQHSLNGLAYGYSYDDHNQSTTIATGAPEHMTFTVNW